MTTELNKAPLGQQDLLFGDSTAPVDQERLGPDGAFHTTPIAPIDSAVIPLSTAAKTALGMTGDKDLDDFVQEVVSGGTLPTATTATAGISKVDDDGGGAPVAVTTTGAGTRIPTANVAAALAGTGRPPDYDNPVVTQYGLMLALSLSLGSGKDGHGKLGAIAANSTAPTITSTDTAGLLTGTYTYKIAAYNLSGAIVASSASASTGAISAKQVTMALPALPSNAMGWRIYRSTDGANWYLVGTAVLGFNYTETASDARRYLYTDNNPTPNTSQSAPGSDTTGQTATLSGLFQFITLTTVASDAITVANTGNTAGLLDIRVQGTWTGADAAWTITGTGANAVNVNGLKMGGSYGIDAYSHVGMFTGQNPRSNGGWGINQTAAWTTTAATQPVGLGVDRSMVGRLLSGFGTKGNGSTGGDGNYGGALVRIWGRRTATGTIGGTITVNGGAGVNGTSNGAGGGGGAGGLIDFGMLEPWADVGTRNAAGGVGGNGAGSGRGGGGGGGGAVVRRNCFSKSGATTSVAAGATGTNGGTTADGGMGGAHYGNGGVNGSSIQTAASAGQQFDFNGLYDPSGVFAA